MTAPYRVSKWTFHWKFWHPKDCIGGKVYFGWWAECVNKDLDFVTMDLTPAQVHIKRSMGLIE